VIDEDKFNPVAFYELDVLFTRAEYNNIIRIQFKCNNLEIVDDKSQKVH